MMKRVNFYQGIGIALIASLLGSAIYLIFSTGLDDLWLLQTLIPILFFSYVIYLLSQSQDRIGHVSVITIWTLVASVNWFLMPPLVFSLCLHLGLIWLIRSLYYYSSILSSLMDLCLSSLALGVGIWAGIHTNSLFAGIWSFFLIQSMFVFIPNNLKKTQAMTNTPFPEGNFDKAYRNAESELRHISSRVN